MPWLQARSSYSVTAARAGDSTAVAQPVEVTAVPHTTLRSGKGDVAMGGVSVAFATLLQQCRVSTLAWRVNAVATRSLQRRSVQYGQNRLPRTLPTCRAKGDGCTDR